jgi:Lipocalin-like domain
MNRCAILSLSAITALGLALLPGSAVSQQKSLKDQLVGIWILVEAPQWGPNPKGQLSLEANGRYSSVLLRSDLAKYASNNRTQTTPQEDKATVQGTLATFGTYTVNETERTYTIHVEGSSFPNWNGTDQKRNVVSITADELKVTNPAPSIGGSPTQTVYRRVK